MIHFQHHHEVVFAVLLFRGITPTQKLVLAVLASFADKDGKSIFPSYQTIADQTGYSRRAVIRAVKDLCALGLISKRQERLSSSNIYEIILEIIVKGSITLIPQVVTHSHQASDPMTLEVLNLESNPVDNCSIPSVPSDTRSPELVTHVHQSGDTRSPNHNQLTKPLINNKDREPYSPLNPVSKIDKPKPKTKTRSSAFDDETEAEFMQFWKLFPRAKEMPKTREEYLEARKKSSHQEIMVGVRNYLLAIKIEKTELKFIKYSCRWLRDERWKDDYKTNNLSESHRAIIYKETGDERFKPEEAPKGTIPWAVFGLKPGDIP